MRKTEETELSTTADIDAPPERRRPRRLRALLGAAVGLLLLVGLFVATGAELSGLVAPLARVPLWGYGALALANLAAVALSAKGWQLVLARLSSGPTLSGRDALAATGGATVLGQVLPLQVAIPLIRTLLARRRGIDARLGAGSSLINQTFDLLGLGAVVAAVLAYGATLSVAAAGAVLIAAPLAVLALVGPIAATLGRLPRLGGLRALGRLDWALRVQLMTLSVLRMAAIAVIYVLPFLLFRPGLDPLPLLALFPLVLALTSLPILPAGLGAFELSWAGALVLQGVSGAEAAELALAARIAGVIGLMLVSPVFLWALAAPRRSTGS
ncbi:lysylphosphatidylglycerol synthase domain-containing protein [Litorisediminicola beolgyonensis]|uniref:Lysylphosphatidylglycerol synthase domain-containing protein n=1 Tax=Litorisediminicola beolgyonensis TaxID=1173614 RepID=A0ABW3ZJU8_9RHOB